MTPKDINGDASDNRLAFAAVSLCGNKRRGNPPEWHELAAWRAGTLSGRRADEVLSHVANDPSCFQQWLDIAEAEVWAEEVRVEEKTLTAAELPERRQQDLQQNLQPAESRHASERIDIDARVETPADRDRTAGASLSSLTNKISGWLRSLAQQQLSVYGGAFAAVVLAVLVAPLLQTGDGLSIQQQLDRSMDTYIDTSQGFVGSPPPARSTRSLSGLFDELSTSDVERLHFQYGMVIFNQHVQRAPAEQVSTSEQWQAWLSELSENPVDCDTVVDAAHCTSVATEFQQLGQWSLMNAAVCQSLSTQGQVASDERYWSEQYALYDQIRALRPVASSQVFAPLLPELQERSPVSLCTIVATLVAAAQ